MLYDLWQQVLSTRRNDTAVWDIATGASHRFGDLQDLLDALPHLAKGCFHPVSVGQGGVNFLLQTLRGWRDEAVVCPLEVGAPPWPHGARAIPAGIAHLKTTSGTTGEPRCVLFRADQLVADATQIRETMKLDPALPNLAVISIAHSYGFSNLVLPLLLQGHPLILAPDALPSSLRGAFALGHRVTLPAVPAMWRAWHHGDLLKDAPIGLAISAGAPLPLELEKSVYETSGLKLHNFYGSSECGGIAYDTSDTPREDASIAGQAMSGVDLSVQEDGCLVVHSQAAGEGYWPQPDAALTGGKFTTSDLVEVNAGTVFMRGRVSDAINIAGRKLNPAEVEAALLAHEGVRHCVVFGVPSADAARCEETVACLSTKSDLTSTELSHWLGSRLQTWQLPRHFWFRQDLKPNARGKFPRPEWRKKWLVEQAG